MNQPTHDHEFIDAVGRFVQAFRHVFHYDWHDTRTFITHGQALRPDNATFINPGLDNDEEFNNWDSRGHLLDAYRDVAERLREQGKHPDQQEDNTI